MEKQMKPLPAIADQTTQAVLRQALGDLAGQFAQRTNRLSESIESQRHESPLFVTTQDASLEPTKTPGMLWHVVDNGLVYYYDAGADEFMSVSQTIQTGNNNVISLGGGVYVVSRLFVPDNVYLETITVDLFAGGACGVTVNAYVFGGASFASGSTSTSGAGHAAVSLNIDADYNTGFALEVRVTVTSGSLPETSVLATYRRLP